MVSQSPSRSCSGASERSGCWSGQYTTGVGGFSILPVKPRV
jgi:hypothetical protein